MERTLTCLFHRFPLWLLLLLFWGAALTPASAQLSITFLKTDVTCAGRCDGLAIALGQGGTFPYTYQWSTGDNSSQIDSLCPAVYTVTVTDASMATATGSITIFEPNPLLAAVATEDQICGVAPDGTATAIPIGGTAPYGFLWSNGETTAQITGLEEGTYTVTITDVNGCTAVGDGFVFFQNEGIWLMATPIHISCFGAADGQVYATPMTGTPPYTYDWGPGFPDTLIIKHLPPGEYTVTVTDVNGCSNTATAEVEEPPALDVVASFAPAACGVPGSATVAISGGTPGYSVLWSNGDTTLTVSGPAGPIGLTVTDANGCVLALPLDIPGNNTIVSANTDKLADALCLRGGQALAKGTGGSGVYTFLWSRGDTTAAVLDLVAGVYTVTITEVLSGCTATSSVTIGVQTSSLTLDASVLAPAGCTVGGRATAVATGGEPPYQYVWNNKDTTQTVANLPTGPNFVAVTDSAGCTATDTVLVPQAPPLVLSAAVVSPVTCLAGGKIEAIASGGLPPYAYLWSTSDTVGVLGGLGAGTYAVTATDAGGCTAVASVLLVDPPQPSVGALSITQVTCVAPGSATATAVGGTPPYTFAWSNGATGPTASSLAPGTYTVVIADANGCTAAQTFTLVAPPQPTVNIGITAPVTCVSAGALAASASGGTPPYAFTWSNSASGAILSGLPAGTYTVTVSDASGCTAQMLVVLPAPPAVAAFIQKTTNAGCAGPGSATAAVTGGTPPFTYTWSNGTTSATAANLSPGTYTVTVVDALGCSDTAVAVITSSGPSGIRLGDFVWFDDDQDGIQAPQEKGVPGIKVRLIAPGPDTLFFTPDDLVLDSTLTDSTGKYAFECVTPGKYVVGFSGLPTGYQFSAKNKGNNSCRDSDANSNGFTDPITVLAGQDNNLCVDAGIHTFCINVTKPGIICCHQTICEGETPTLLYGSPLFPPQGGVGPLEFLWMQYVQVKPNQWLWLPIPGATDSVYQPGPLYTTSYFMRCVRRAGCVNFLESNIITITVKPAGSPGCTKFFLVFSADRLPAGSVRLEWRTAPEVTRYRYVVERSSDGQNWRSIGAVPGTENASEASAYTWIDYLPEYGMNYYRVCRIGPLGANTFSEVREVMVDTDLRASLVVAPNPVSDVLYVRNTMPYDADAQVQIFHADGSLLYTADIPQGHMAYWEISTSHWPAGMYFARIRWSGGQTHAIKVSKFF